MRNSIPSITHAGNAIATLTLLVALASTEPALGADGTAPRDPGIWQKHEYSFAFMGFTTTYSCDGLADKLKLLLIAAGARPDVKAHPSACASSFGRPDKLARAEVTFYTLTPVSAADPHAASADAKEIDGSWKSVELARLSPVDLGAGDCELVDQFRSSLLPLFTTRNVASSITCVPHQLSGSSFDLKFEAFSATPKPAAARTPPA